MTLALLILQSTLLVAADQALGEGDYATAIDAYRGALAEDPANFDARFGLGRALAYSGNHDAAAKVYSQLLAIHPENGDVRLARGLVLAWMERYPEAEADLLDVARKHPDYVAAWMALGDLYLWTGRPEEAIESFARWCELEPKQVEPFLHRAAAYRDAGQWDEADLDLQRAAERGADEDAIDAGRRELRQLRRAAMTDAWEVGARYDFMEFGADRTLWHQAVTTIRRYHPLGSVAVESGLAHRFDRTDALVGLDAYSRLWAQAYTHASAQWAPDGVVLPAWDVRAELYQGLPGPFEIWGSYRYMAFTDVDVHLPGAGLGLYVGDWWFGSDTWLIESRGEVGFATSLTARYTYDTVDDLFELRAGLGRQVLEEGPGRATTEPGWTVAFRAQRMFETWFGMSLATRVEQEGDVLGWGLGLGTLLRL